MVEIELIPDLTHCIETVAKKEHKRVVNKLLSGTVDEGIKERAEILKKFLETADFRRLRQESEPYLTQGRKVKFVIRSEKGEPSYTMQVT